MSENPLREAGTLVKSAKERNLKQNDEIITSGQLYTGKQPPQEGTVLS